LISKIIPGSGDLYERTEKTLRRLIENMLDVPETSEKFQKTTMHLIADFIDALNDDNRNEANTIIQECVDSNTPVSSSNSNESDWLSRMKSEEQA